MCLPSQDRVPLEEITKKGIFGTTVAHIYTIEFQKRGLPHMHLLIFLDAAAKPITPAQVDSIVCAELPDQAAEPHLYSIVSKVMIHRPCGTHGNSNAVCLDDKGKCTKGFPKPFSEETMMTADGYPTYRRRNTGIHEVGGQAQSIDNCWVVPYNPYLSGHYECHINVEVCVSVRATKYIHKYIFKGHDRITAVVEQDEIKQYLDARWLGDAEAMYRLFAYHTHKEWPPVERLPIHLPNEQTAVYDPARHQAAQVIQRAAGKDTKLLAFFKLNEADHRARNLLYSDIPYHYCWEEGVARDNLPAYWKERSRNTMAIGRMYFVSPIAGERYFLRMLLTHVRGPTSFKALRTVNGVLHPNFKSACLALGLLGDDEEWRHCLDQAANFQTGTQLRSLFVLLLIHCVPAHPPALWETYKLQICDDLPRVLQTRHQLHAPTDDQVVDFGLFLIRPLLQRAALDLPNFQLPLPVGNWAAIQHNHYIAQQLDYHPERERAAADACRAQMNPEQLRVYEHVLQCIHHKRDGLFFLNGPGGTGKTFVYQAISHAIRGQGKIVLCVASSGIASILLPGGQTSHSCFGIPLDVDETSHCHIPKNGLKAELLRQTVAIIWDEVPMQNRYCMEAVDHSMKDVLDNNRPFGGIVVLWGGDFRQILPVVEKGNREDIVLACIQRSYLWQDVHIFHLTQNMRLEQTPEEQDFAQWLLSVGEGRNEENVAVEYAMPLPDHVKIGGQTAEEALERFLLATYPGISNPGPRPPGYFTERTILTTRNETVDELNHSILAKCSGVTHTFVGYDKVVHETEERQIAEDVNAGYAPEYLATLTPNGFPKAKLEIKVGCPVMLLRNLDPSQGLCNGTRLLITRTSTHVLEGCILGGEHDGKPAFIPRITLHSQKRDFTFILARRQFPVRLAFAMTINKSQGQSVKHVGIDLRTPVFTHGQLYVALSRATAKNRIYVLFPEGEAETQTRNVVYPEVLLR